MAMGDSARLSASHFWTLTLVHGCVCVARPYTMVFVGINGVGKSTSLSKVCYYLKSHGLKVRPYTIVSAINRENPMGGRA